MYNVTGEAASRLPKAVLVGLFVHAQDFKVWWMYLHAIVEFGLWYG